MNLFYHPQFDPNAKVVTFDKDESRHLAKSLRVKEGQQIWLTDGKGHKAAVTISLVDPKRTEGHVIKVESQPVLKPYLHLAIAPTKMNDRYEWFLEKATELGVNRITPIICAHSERKIIKPERMQKIIISGMKQSLQCHLPQFDEAISYDSFMQNLPKLQDTFIAHCEASTKLPLHQAFETGRSALILIGPEGDFSSAEIETAEKLGLKSLSLGKNRLRTETAGLAAVMAFRMVNPL